MARPLSDAFRTALEEEIHTLVRSAIRQVERTERLRAPGIGRVVPRPAVRTWPSRVYARYSK